MKLDPLIDKWLQDRPNNVWTRSLAANVRAVAEWLESSGRSLAQADMIDIEPYLHRLRDVRRRDTASALRQFFAFLVEEGIRQDDVHRLVAQHVAPRGPRRYVTPSAVNRFLDRLDLEALRTDTKRQVSHLLKMASAACELAYSTGLSGEALATIRRTDLDSGALTVDALYDGSRRKLPITPRAMDAVTRWTRYSDDYFGREPSHLFVTLDPDRQIQSRYFSETVMRARHHLADDVATGITLKGLRVSFGVHMRERGFDDEYIMFVLGLANQGSFRRFFRHVVEIDDVKPILG